MGPTYRLSLPHSCLCRANCIHLFNLGERLEGTQCHKGTFFFFFNGHFLSGVTCMTVCDKQKLMGTLLCQFLLNCWHWLQAACLPPSQDLTWNMARGPQLYSPTSQLVSDERSRNNAGRTNQEENALQTASNQGGSICWELIRWFIFLSGKLQTPIFQSTFDIRSIPLPWPSKVYKLG